MADLLMLVVVAGFFTLCLGYVALCDRVVGPDGELADPTTAEATEVPA